MNISDLLAPEAVLASLKAQTKKQLLQELAARAHARTQSAGKADFRDPDRARTPGHHRASGAGIAIPHGRMAGATTITGVFARLESAIDYEAVDGQPVDLVFMLLAPENAGADHLKALARVSRLLRNQQTCEKLRAAQSAEALYAILIDQTGGSSSQGRFVSAGRSRRHVRACSHAPRIALGLLAALLSFSCEVSGPLPALRPPTLS